MWLRLQTLGTAHTLLCPLSLIHRWPQLYLKPISRLDTNRFFSTEIFMDALDSVLADLVDADRDCAYTTIKREALEALIHEWARRGDQMAMLSCLLARARNQLAADHNSHPCNASREETLRALESVVAESASALARHRHVFRRELAARLKQVLRSSIADVGTHATEALLAGNRELAERLESERQTVRIVMSTIDAVVDRLLQDELSAVADLNQRRPSAPLK
jgi:hypothetical protein